MRLEVIQVMRYLLRALARRLSGSPGDLVEHNVLQHAHWNRAEGRWLTHEDEAEVVRAA